jgi:hypothetical protein
MPAGQPARPGQAAGVRGQDPVGARLHPALLVRRKAPVSGRPALSGKIRSRAAARPG